MPAKHTWTFKPRLRTRAFGWKGSHLACQRLKEAATEIKKVARQDQVTAADGVVCLMERIWPAFQDIDTSSGALGGAVNWAQDELLPVVIDLCGSREIASRWADRLLWLLRTAWSDPRPGGYLRGGGVCLSILVAAGRHEELLDLLTLRRFPSWHDRKFGVQALLAQGRVDEALAYAEASRGLNQPNTAIDAECEKILLDAGRTDEAYEKYALTANISSTGLATFRAIVRKYPRREPKKILLDLAESSGDPGRWFAAAKDAGFLDLALEFANKGRTDPRTLSRASRDLLHEDARFCLQAGRLAMQRILEGYGYELTAGDVVDAYDRFLAAADKLGVAGDARNDVLAMATKAQQDGAVFSDTLIRLCSSRFSGKPGVRGATDMGNRKHSEALRGKPIAGKLVAKMEGRRRGGLPR